MRSQTDLHQAFATTDYCVEFRDETITLKLGQPVPEALADWVTARNGPAPTWLITACNPGAEIADESENQARTWLLNRLLDRRGLQRLPAVNRDSVGAWPDEPGWLVAGLEEGLARSLAQRFGQAAIVAVSEAGVALVWMTA